MAYLIDLALPGCYDKRKISARQNEVKTCLEKCAERSRNWQRKNAAP